MSIQTKQLWEMILKTSTVVLFGFTVFILSRFYERSESTRETIIRVETKVIQIDRDVEIIKADIKSMQKL